MSDSKQPDPKIIVDDDWKAQVEKEREQAKSEPPSRAESSSESIPPASFPILISTLASQALAGLGAIPDPIENKPVVRLDLAKHMIDTLGMLDEKTKGNLTGEESQMLTGTLHQLRMAYLAASSSTPGPSAKESSIELP